MLMLDSNSNNSGDGGSANGSNNSDNKKEQMTINNNNDSLAMHSKPKEQKDEGFNFVSNKASDGVYNGTQIRSE